LYNNNKRTQKGVLENKSDITKKTKQIKNCLLLDVATLSDTNVTEKKPGKSLRHKNLSIQIQGM